MTLTYTQRVLSSLIPLVFTATSNASECNDLAPLADHNDAENGYFDMPGHTIDGNDKARLEKLADALQGNWTGVELVKDCIGHFSAPTEKLHHNQVIAQISRHATGAIRIEAEKGRQSDRVVQLETLFISPETDTEYGRLHGWHTLDFIDDNTVIFSEKSRVRSGNSFARFIHVVNKIELRDNKLTVDRKLWVNGHFVEQNGWILER